MVVSTGQPLGQCRAAPVNLGEGAPEAFVAAFSADFDVDPYPEMFFPPDDTLKLAVFTFDGRELWRRDLGRGVPPGMWFAPVLPVDLDGDGAVWDAEGRSLGNVGGPVALLSKVVDRLGEQLLWFHLEGTLRLWGWAEARDSAAALARYGHRFYGANQRLTATGYNLGNLGGI